VWKHGDEEDIQETRQNQKKIRRKAKKTKSLRS